MDMLESKLLKLSACVGNKWEETKNYSSLSFSLFLLLSAGFMYSFESQGFLLTNYYYYHYYYYFGNNRSCCIHLPLWPSLEFHHSFTPCLVPGDTQGQSGLWVPDGAVDVPAHCKGVGLDSLQRSFPILMTLWFQTDFLPKWHLQYHYWWGWDLP